MSQEQSKPGHGTHAPVLQSQRVTVSDHSGPLPDAETLARYNAIIPGSAERIIAMAAREAATRHLLLETQARNESDDMKAMRAERKRGQILGFILSLLVLITIVICCFSGAQVAAAIIGATGIGGIVAAFFYGRHDSEIISRASEK
jgi:uncharacterized membrane protein